jgi:hypothetical protein
MVCFQSHNIHKKNLIKICTIYSIQNGVIMSRASFSLTERKWVKIKIYLERACELVKFRELGISQIQVEQCPPDFTVSPRAPCYA